MSLRVSFNHPAMSDCWNRYRRLLTRHAAKHPCACSLESCSAWPWFSPREAVDMLTLHGCRCLWQHSALARALGWRRAAKLVSELNSGTTPSLQPYCIWLVPCRVGDIKCGTTRCLLSTSNAHGDEVSSEGAERHPDDVFHGTVESITSVIRLHGARCLADASTQDGEIRCGLVDANSLRRRITT